MLFGLLVGGPVSADGSVASLRSEASDSMRVRVLLFDASQEVRVDAGSDRFRVRAVRGGLKVGRGKPVAQWETGSDTSVTRVGSFRVRGRVIVLRTPKGIAVVNDVPIETYLAGTLGSEMYPGWHPEALRAQAVASRTYALYRARQGGGGEPYALTSGTSSQVYRGTETETESVWQAVRATRGEVLTQGGQPILAAFHSDAGGQTASSKEVWGKDLVYLRSHAVIDEGDSPDTYWRSAIARTTIRRAVERLGDRVGAVRSLDVVERSASGRVKRVRVIGEAGELEWTGRELRSALGASVIRSTLFEIRETQEHVVFVGSGRGHGVGMSQWGANAMAQRGTGYRAILKHFYPGTRLERMVATRRHEETLSSASLAQEGER